MGADEPGVTQRRVVKAACPHDCPDTCAMEITVENGVAVEVRGAAMPFTEGTLCTKVAKYLERTYSKDRVLHPLRRVGAKGPGQGRLERISWDEALDEIAARFKAIAAEDPQQILPCSYAGTMGTAPVHVDGSPVLQPSGREPARSHAVLFRGQGRREDHARRLGGDGSRALRRGEADPHLGLEPDRLESAPAGRAARRRSAAARS